MKNNTRDEIHVDIAKGGRVEWLKIVEKKHYSSRRKKHTNGMAAK
jgi:hypothetical protein